MHDTSDKIFKNCFLCQNELHLPKIYFVHFSRRTFNNTPFDFKSKNIEFLIALSHWVLKAIFLDLNRTLTECHDKQNLLFFSEKIDIT